MPRSAFHRSLEMQVALQHLQTLMLFVSTQDWMLIIQLDSGNIQCIFLFSSEFCKCYCLWLGLQSNMDFLENIFQMFLPLTLSSLLKRVFKVLNSLIHNRAIGVLREWRCEGAAQSVGSPRAGDKGHKKVWGGCWMCLGCFISQGTTG